MRSDTNTPDRNPPGGLRRELGLRDLVLFHVVAIVGLRWIAVAAQAGPSSLSLWLLAFLLFFVPQATAVMRLTSAYPDEGGIYRWTQRAFGRFHGFVSGWCYWSNNVVYYPTVLFTMAGYALFVLGPGPHPLEDSTPYLLIFSIVGLWMAIGSSMIGLKQGKWLQNVGGLATWIPAAILLAFGVIAATRFGSATKIDFASLIPDIANSEQIIFFSSLCFGFAGLELASIMGGEIRDPRRNGPKAVLIAGATITAVYLLGTWALMTALPSGETSVITGVVQAISTVGAKIGAAGVGPAVALLVTLGSLAATGAWLGGSARILFTAGLDRYFPASLGKVHPRWGTPHRAIIVQGVAATVFLIASKLGSTTRDAYLILLDTTLIVYFIPYLYMFAALVKLEGTIEDAPGTWKVPGGAIVSRLLGLIGLATTVFAMVLAVIPPGDSEAPQIHLIKVVGGALMFVVVAFVLYARGERAK